MKFKYQMYIIFTLMVTVLSCTVKDKISKMSFQESCTDKLPCMELFDCAKSHLLKGDFDQSFSDSVSNRQLLLCTSQLASEGNKEAHQALMSYFLSRYNNLKIQQVNPATIADYENRYEVKAFVKLRGAEPFELALKYAEKCDCFEISNDISTGGEPSLNIIQFVITPMIKTAGGEPWLDRYFRRIREIPLKYDEGFCKREHEFQYNALVNAYKEGKIVLKKYGEK